MGVTFYAKSGKTEPQIHASVNLGEDTLIDCHARVTIGPDTFFGHRAMVLTGGHDPLRYGADRRSSSASRPVVIGTGVWVCSGAIICPGVTIGDHAVVGPGAVVLRNVPAYGVVIGNPARLVKRVRPAGVA